MWRIRLCQSKTIQENVWTVCNTNSNIPFIWRFITSSFIVSKPSQLASESSKSILPSDTRPLFGKGNPSSFKNSKACFVLVIAGIVSYPPSEMPPLIYQGRKTSLTYIWNADGPYMLPYQHVYRNLSLKDNPKYEGSVISGTKIHSTSGFGLRPSK